MTQKRTYNAYQVPFLTSSKNYYIWYKGALTLVIPVELQYEYKEATDNYAMKIIWKLPDNTFINNPQSNIYSSIDNFENNKIIHFDSISVNNIIRDMSNDKIENINGTYWFFENNEAKKGNLDLNSFAYNFEKRWHSEDFDSIKNNCYKTKQDCLSYNSYTYINKDNEKFIKTGCNKTIQLDKSQKALISKLEDLLKEIEENDIKLVFDATESIYAYNLKNADNFDFSYDSSECCFADEVEESWITNRLDTAFKIESNIEYYGEDYFLIVATNDKKVTE